MSDEPSSTPPRRVFARSGAATAILIALIALACAGWALWREKVMQQAAGAASERNAGIESRLGALEHALGSVDAQRENAARRLADAETGNRALQDGVQQLDQRVRNLESVYANLSDRSLSAQDALRLDDTEFLLRGGQQRYVLFHDAADAARAYALADQTLAALQAPDFAPVRAAIAEERAQLEAAAAPARQTALDQLQALRALVPALALAEAHPEIGMVQAGGMWPRLRDAFGSVLRVRRDNGAPLPAADAKLARELAALDLAQAQAALLAYDDAGYRDALQRADAMLAAQFDPTSGAVRQARATLTGLLKAPAANAAAPQLGGALAQLRALRAAHAREALTAPAASAMKPHSP